MSESILSSSCKLLISGLFIMDQATSFSSALSRLETALERLEHAATGVGTKDGGENARVHVLEAERDLLQLKHRRLVQSTERAVADLDALIASKTGS